MRSALLTAFSSGRVLSPRRFILLGAILFGLCGTGRAAVVDWGGLPWTPGTLTNSYDVDNASAGNDVTLSVTGTTDELVNDGVNNQPTPNINTNLEGGLSPVQSSLNIAIDLGKKDRFVTVTITFSAQYAQGVENVSFTLFGIDQASGGSNLYIDEITSISATAIDGTTLIAPTITGVGTGVSHTGTGVSQVLTGLANVPNTGPGSGAGNATISFNATGIRSVTFTFGAGGNSAVNPIFQDISLHDVTFSAVPEMNPAHIAAGLSLMGLAIKTRRFRSRRR